MLVLLWTELQTISAQIDRIQDARATAKQNADTGLVGTLSAELADAVSARENLVARIGGIVGDVGELRAPAARAIIKNSATSPYLNRRLRSLSEIFEVRQKTDIRPLSNPTIWDTRLSLGPMDSASSFDILNMTIRMPVESM